MSFVITSSDIFDMVTHWLNTPIEGYLGSDYGSDPKSLLLQPQKTGLADVFINKLRNDIPLLADADINVFFDQDGIDKKRLILDVAGQEIPISLA